MNGFDHFKNRRRSSDDGFPPIDLSSRRYMEDEDEQEKEDDRIARGQSLKYLRQTGVLNNDGEEDGRAPQPMVYSHPPLPVCCVLMVILTAVCAVYAVWTYIDYIHVGGG